MVLETQKMRCSGERTKLLAVGSVTNSTAELLHLHFTLLHVLHNPTLDEDDEQ